MEENIPCAATELSFVLSVAQ